MYFVLLALAGSMVGGVKIKRVREQRRARARIRALPPSARITEGAEVRIRGTVRVLDETLRAPLSGHTCVLYRARIVSAGHLMSKQRAAQSTESFVMRPFLLDRGAEGTVIVDGDHAELDLPASPRKTYARDRLESFRLLHGLPRGQRLRVDEVILAPGAEVTIVGTAIMDPEPAPPTGEVGFRDGAPLRLRLTGSRARPLTIARV